MAAGRGGELMLVPGWWYVISANTYVEFLDNCPDTVQLAARIPCETLFVRDSSEPAEVYPAEEVAANAPRRVTVSILDAGGHYYTGGEDLVATCVVRWLEPKLPGTPAS